jgi:L-galactose dehydrogenase
MITRILGNTGIKVSALSFGASSLGSVFRHIDESEGIKTVHYCLDNGINFIDVSPYYGETKAEIILGKALKDIPRDRFVLASKVGQYKEGEFDFSAKRTLKSFEDSCKRLNVDYIDLLQCHDIEFADFNQIVDETLPTLKKLKDSGKIGHVGVTGLPLKVFKSILDRTEPGLVETILSFCHYTLNDNSLESFLPYLKSKNVGVINASPTGMGLLSERGAPIWHPASDVIRQGCKTAVNFCKTQGINIAKVAVQFSISHPDITTTLISSANPENMKNNISYANSIIDRNQIEAVLSVLKPIQNFNFSRGRLENQDPIIT